jgi:CRP/FNR family transcriptional regulator, cyclic AMP receptor protein
MTGSSRPRVEVLAADPDLALHVAPEVLDVARRRAVAEVRVYEAREWREAIGTFDGTGHLGLLVLDGLLARRVTIGSRAGAELLGPGDVLRPWVKAGPSDSVLADVDWSVVATARIAVLDREFALRIAPWPEIIALLGDRILLGPRRRPSGRRAVLTGRLWPGSAGRPPTAGHDHAPDTLRASRCAPPSS